LFLVVPNLSLAGNSVSTDSTLGIGLLDYYTLDEVSGIRYSATSTQNLTDNNTVASITGLQGLAADFESSNTEWLSITDAAQTNLDLNSDFTLCYSYKPESLPDYAMHISKFGSTNNTRSYRVGHSASTAIIQIGFASGSNVNTATWTHSLVTGVWGFHCYQYSKANGTSTYYYDAVSQGTKTGLGSTIANTSSAFELCRSNNPAEYYCDGVLEEVFILNRIASQAEITRLFNLSTRLPYLPTVDNYPTISVVLSDTITSMLTSVTCTGVAPTTTCSYVYSTTTPEIDIPNLTLSGSLFGFFLLTFIVFFGFIFYFKRKSQS